MDRFCQNFIFFFLIGMMGLVPACAQSPQPKYVMVIHGGAGTMKKENMSPEKEEEYKNMLREALTTGYEILKKGESAADAVVATINILEDSPLFNAGKGAVFTHEGKNELDASIMDGKTLQAGAVAGVTNIKNPINAARAVMDHSRHVMLTGRGAEIFALEQGCDTVSPSYFYTESRWQSLQRILGQEKNEDMNDLYQHPGFSPQKDNGSFDEKYGTVGAVAMDATGNIVAGTSTGGLTNKRFGRVGDSPVIGAGTYANHLTAGISCTGTGEYFMRSLAAYRVSVLMELEKLGVQEAADQVIAEIGKLGGDGGLIALDHEGRVAFSFNTSGMYRGTVDENGHIEVMIFADE